MTIIVDTNIIFSALLNSDGQIGDLLFNSAGIFNFVVAVTCGTKYTNIGNG